MNGALTIARFTLHEAVSRRLVLAGLLLSLAFVGLYALGFYFAYQSILASAADVRSRTIIAIEVNVLTLLGLFAVSFMQSFLALFLSVGAISAEVDSGALHAVLARPLRRYELVIGRWLAYVLMMVCYVVLMVGLILLVTRGFAGYEPLDLPRALALMSLEALVLLSLSLFGSTWLPTLANGVVCFSLFGLAWLGGMIETVGTVLKNDAMVQAGIVVSLLIPSDGLWRAASYYLQSPAALALIGSNGAPFFSQSPPALPFVLWGIAYVAAMLGGALVAFSRRDL